MGLGENLLKYWKYYAIVAAIISLIGWAYTQGSSAQEIESRIFTTTEMKYTTESYMKSRPSAAQEQRQFYRDSAKAVAEFKNAESARKSRAIRDSIYLNEVRARKKTDSVVLLNADQMYQIKEQLKKLNNN